MSRGIYWIRADPWQLPGCDKGSGSFSYLEERHLAASLAISAPNEDWAVSQLSEDTPGVKIIADNILIMGEVT